MTDIKNLIPVQPKDKVYSKMNLKSGDITLELLDEAYKASAEIVKLHGDKYLPIFIRMHKEIEQRKNNQFYKEIALQIETDDS